ncbi:hypothetical protein FQY83_06870 [Luteimonas marina]|uniref:Uncharacterized protein n=1 Tax=Luteimonas marina TaxID=488485 RepID=A0A5C5U5K2_9GAMM|nr:hypothetical protein [Luteimonas marina]TWT21079.1 hypothetical protein FQY83_06870 [Luteimonas marina]
MAIPTRLLFAAALAASLSAAPAIAQDGAATLRIESGSAMVSTDGEFTTAASGTQVAPGNRVMLPEGSRATLVYPNGCTQPLREGGTYTVPATCVAAAGSSGGAGAGVDYAGLGIVTGLVVAGAAGLASMDQQDVVTPPPPVSR